MFTDRNAALVHPPASATPTASNGLVDWDLMEARIWRNTDTDFERKERRMASALVHGRVDSQRPNRYAYDEGPGVYCRNHLA